MKSVVISLRGFVFGAILIAVNNN
ncbi:uncharacterized protein METZ01_LOCUS220850 [marine metagenome]|uniref:Uncharacterized protein n=1 Tax=marine metagenome TaxID=408172 RepID=A0A382FY34_9ZZZZ